MQKINTSGYLSGGGTRWAGKGVGEGDRSVCTCTHTHRGVHTELTVEAYTCMTYFF